MMFRRNAFIPSGGGAAAGVGGGNSWGFRASNVLDTRPVSTGGTLGTSVTPGNNTKGSWTQILPALAQTTYLLEIGFCLGRVSGQARDILADVGVDPAGGSSYSVLVPDLLCSCSAAPNGVLSVLYYFPIRIASGSTVAVRGSVNNATVGTFRAVLFAYGAPADVSRIRYGSYVRAYGVNQAASCGTPVTPGTTSEGTWTELTAGTGSTIAGGDAPWFWQMGFGINNNNMAALHYFMDGSVGAAGGDRIVGQEVLVYTDGTEQALYHNRLQGSEYDAAAGLKTFGRLQCSGTADTGISMAMYGLGG